MNCLGCGVRQERWTNSSGKEATNIDPITHLCVACLVKAVAEQTPPSERPFDAKLAQTGEQE